MTRCRSRSQWRSRPVNAKDAVPRPSKGNSNAMYVAWCWRESPKLKGLPLQSAARQPCTSLDSSTTSKGGTSRPSPGISLRPLVCWEIRLGEVQARGRPHQAGKRPCGKSDWNGLHFGSGQVYKKMPHLRKACWLRERMNTIVSVTTSFVLLTSRSPTARELRWRWVSQRLRKSNTMQCGLFTWTLAAGLTSLTDSDTLISPGCKCIEQKSILRRNTSTISTEILTTTCWCQTQGSIRWQSMTLSGIFGTSRTPTWIHTKPMRLKRSSSQIVQKRSEAKRKAEQTSAYGQGPAKKGTANPVARTSPKVEAASSSTSAGVCVARPPSVFPSRSTLHWWVAEVAPSLVPKGDQAWTCRMGRGISSAHLASTIVFV